MESIVKGAVAFNRALICFVDFWPRRDGYWHDHWHNKRQTKQKARFTCSSLSLIKALFQLLYRHGKESKEDNELWPTAQVFPTICCLDVVIPEIEGSRCFKEGRKDWRANMGCTYLRLISQWSRVSYQIIRNNTTTSRRGFWSHSVILDIFQGYFLLWINREKEAQMS